MTDHWAGDRVRLRAIEPADAEELFALGGRDHEAQRRTHHVEVPYSLHSLRKRLEESRSNVPGDDRIELLICTHTGEIAGRINTNQVDRRTGVFQFGITIHERFRRKGYAAEAIRLLLRYFFEELGYQKCNSVAWDFNEESIALHRTLGFVEEGRRRRTQFTDGQYRDEVLLGITREEFAARGGGA